MQDSEPADPGPGSFAARARRVYGRDVDPGISLDSGDAAAPGATPVTRHTLELITRLSRQNFGGGRYTLKEEIARGGMGAILKVWDQDLRRHLAMKVIVGKGADPAAPQPLDEASVARFLEEAQITGQLDHPGIVPVHELGLDSSGRLFFTMRLVRGRDLKQVLQLVAGGLEGWTQARALGVLLKVCEAMAYAHAKGVIHRDLKPSNIMVGRFGEVYVMDWGLARVLGRPDPRDLRLQDESAVRMSAVVTDRTEEREQTPSSPVVTLDGAVIGTPSYMPPEQAMGLLETLGPRSDVYSVGAMLYQLLAGQMPYVPPLARTPPYAVLHMLQHGPPRPVPELQPGAPAELVAICDKAMARDPEQRYANTLDMARDIEAYLDRRPVSAHAEGLGYELKLWIQRNKAVAATAATAAVLVLVLVAVFIARLGQEVGRTRTALQRSDILSTQALLDQVEELYPIVPATAPRMRTWLEQAEELTARVSGYGPPGGGDLAQAAQRVERIRALIPQVRAHAEQAEILDRICFLDNKDLWDQVIAELGPLEGLQGERLRPQQGLVPLRKDPQSGLWEFWVVTSGDRPQANAGAGYTLTPDSGIVLVLLPGGAFEMGAVRYEGDKPRGKLDEGAVDNEKLHRVPLAPVFIGKYEVTQGQWLRVMGRNPSYYREGMKTEASGQSFTLLHPVELVNWFECDTFARRLDLQLPTEAQWEYACRAGTRGAWPWDSLENRENILDQSRAAVSVLPNAAPWDDRYPYHAPAGSFAPNAFGLFDMCGNVAEWCADWVSLYPGDADLFSDGRMPDPPPPQQLRKVFRGGSWFLPPQYCRSAFRSGDPPLTENSSRGVRVARPVQP